MHSSNLKKHMATHGTSSEPFSLNSDDSNEAEKIKTEKITESHVKISKKNVVKPHKCEHCDRAFVSRYECFK